MLLHQEGLHEISTQALILGINGLNNSFLKHTGVPTACECVGSERVGKVSYEHRE